MFISKCHERALYKQLIVYFELGLKKGNADFDFVLYTASYLAFS